VIKKINHIQALVERA